MKGLPETYGAVVDERKITQYLLATDHPAGRAKAAFFRRFGFRPEAWQELRIALLDHAAAALVRAVAQTEFGIKYVLEGRMRTPDDRQPAVRAVWFVSRGGTLARLITAYPLAEADDDQ